MNGRRSARAREAFEHQMEDETAVADHGIQIMKTCTPYLAGNVPVKGEHCAWMESSAVVFCNSVIGGRTNTEGRESTSVSHADRLRPRLGFPPRRIPARHPRHRGRGTDRKHDRLGHARLFHRLRGRGKHPRHQRGRPISPISSATSILARRPRRPAGSNFTTWSASRPRRRRAKSRSVATSRSRRSNTARPNGAKSTSC